MGLSGDQSEKNRAQKAFNLTLAAVAGQVGCLTLAIVVIALLSGLWLDNMYQTRPLFTIRIMVASIPVTLLLMFWVVRKATSKIKTTPRPNLENIQEEANSGRKT